ncbi:hypothetical protein [Herpetosiphon giganteus]|uniref:hypothetical protein n=1 Tax=Herpetosiphon giganteus TaxID=2029754 RepID=UPI00195B2A58|nr:hypothetical protein [Herpetosiphon giganteus]MBM7843069.1 hypothetical protein [Herpetosiphon giganteus]
MNLIQTFCLGSLRNISRNRFLWVILPLLIVFSNFLGLNGDIMYTLFTQSCACLAIVFVHESKCDLQVRETVWSTRYNLVNYSIGRLLAYSIATLIIIGLCEIVMFLHGSNGYIGAVLHHNGEHITISMRFPWQLWLKTFFSMLPIFVLLLCVRNYYRLGLITAIGYWLYIFAFVILLRQNILIGTITSGFYPLRWLAIIPSTNVFLYAWADPIPWILPSLGLAGLGWFGYLAKCMWRKTAEPLHIKPAWLGLGLALSCLSLYLGYQQFVAMLHMYNPASVF